VHDGRVAARTQVLIAYDGSASAQAAIRAAGRLLPGAAARVVAVYGSRLSFEEVVAAGAVPTPEAQTSVAALAGAAMDDARSTAEHGARLSADAGLQAEPVSVEEDRHAWRAILREADSHDVDAVVAGTLGRGGFARALLGSTSLGLLHNAHRPLLIAPEAEPGGDGPVVCAYDGSEEAREAIAVTARIVQRRPAVVVHVWESPARRALSADALGARRLDDIRRISSDVDTMLVSAATSTVEEGAALARGAGLQATGEALESSAGIWRTITSAATERRAALLVVGARGRGRAASALIGSVSAGLVHNVELPTLVVPGG
jgi:nucleotide-binding universal stress UspA family protein